MSFGLPDLIVESIIRDGLSVMRRDPTVAQDVFGAMLLPFANQKYGDREINKINKILQNDEISIVHAFNLVPSNLPCISIQLTDDREREESAHLGNYIRNDIIPFGTPQKIATTVVVQPFIPTSYDPVTGIVLVPDSASLAAVYPNLLFQDGAGNQFPILGGINNLPGQRQFTIMPQAQVVLNASCQIVSSINYDLYRIRGNIEHSQIIIGVHTKEALLTKYFYTLVKYFILSRRDDLIARGLEIVSYSGSDFTRNLEYGADVVYTRFFTVIGTLQNQWRSDKVQLFDSINIIPKVAPDKATNAQLGLQDQTVQETE